MSKKSQAKMLLVVIKDLNMRKGKIASQCAHAAVLAYKTADRSDAAFQSWDQGMFKKITVSVDTTQQLLDLIEIVKAKGILVSPIVDNGLTEFHNIPTLTCAAFGPAWEDDLNPLTSHLKLL